MIGRDGIRVVVRDNNFPRIKRNMQANMAQAFAKTANDVAGDAIAAAPVLTGYLKNSIQAFSLGPFHWVVRVGAEYGVYIEMGTRHMSARPFLHPAFERHIPILIAMLTGGLKESGEGVKALPPERQMVNYTTKAGVTRKATRAQVNNWTRASR